jgi:predicted hydrocarbon binding protein
MKLFKNKEDQENIIIAPKEPKNFNSDLLNTFLVTLASMIDSKDYSYFTSQAAKNFYKQNEVYFKSLGKIGNGSIEHIWENLNMFFELNGLGSSQIVMRMNLENKGIFIFHHNSLFVKYLSDKTAYKLCNFYADLYSLILSDVLQADIKIVEKECSGESGKDYCLFTTA